MDNSTTIQNAFERLARAKDDFARNTLKKALANAMEWALLSHDDRHPQHMILGDNYGWAVVHDGEIVEMDVKAPYGEDGMAETQLRKVARSSKRNGWYGILMAGMDDGKITYYSVDYELGILGSTMDFVRNNFSDFFANKIL